MGFFLMFIATLGVLAGIGLTILGGITGLLGPIVLLLSIIVLGLSQLVTHAKTIETLLRRDPY